MAESEFHESREDFIARARAQYAWIKEAAYDLHTPTEQTSWMGEVLRDMKAQGIGMEVLDPTGRKDRATMEREVEETGRQLQRSNMAIAARYEWNKFLSGDASVIETYNDVLGALRDGHLDYSVLDPTGRCSSQDMQRKFISTIRQKGLEQGRAILESDAQTNLILNPSVQNAYGLVGDAMGKGLGTLVTAGGLLYGIDHERTGLINAVEDISRVLEKTGIKVDTNGDDVRSPLELAQAIKREEGKTRNSGGRNNG